MLDPKAVTLTTMRVRLQGNNLTLAVPHVRRAAW